MSSSLAPQHTSTPALLLPSSLSPEMELLLSCARTRLDDATAARIHELAGGEIDWPSLRALAHRHRVMPLLYRSLYTTCPELVSEDVLGGLRKDYQSNAARNLMLTRELLKVLDALESTGIQAIAYKGPVLAQTAYGDVSLRQFDDLDVLIREEDLWQARDALGRVGFEPVPPYDRFEPANYHRGDGEFKLRHGERGIALEIHWYPVTRTFTFAPDPVDMFRAAQDVVLSGRSNKAIEDETMLLILCAHGTHDGWPRLNYICDITETMHSEPEMDWEMTFNLARELGVQRMLSLGLLLAGNFLGVCYSDPLLQIIHSDRAASSLSRRAFRKLILEEKIDAPLRSRWFEIQALDTYQDRLRFLVELLVKPSIEDWSLLKLPSSLWFLYLPLRYFRVLIKNTSLPRGRGIRTASEVERTHVPDSQ